MKNVFRSSKSRFFLGLRCDASPQSNAAVSAAVVPAVRRGRWQQAAAVPASRRIPPASSYGSRGQSPAACRCLPAEEAAEPLGIMCGTRADVHLLLVLFVRQTLSDPVSAPEHTDYERTATLPRLQLLL